MASTIKTLNVKELSILLNRTVDTIYEDRRKRPNSLPPCLKIPGTSKLIWLESTVEEWLEGCIEKRKGDSRKNH